MRQFRVSLRPAIGASKMNARERRPFRPLYHGHVRVALELSLGAGASVMKAGPVRRNARGRSGTGVSPV